MRRTLLSPSFLCSSSRLLHLLDPKSYSLFGNGKSSSKSSDCNVTLGSSENFRFVFTNTLLPPPEWIEPFVDVSDVISSSQPPDPSPWVTQILNLLDGSSNMEANLDSFCRKFLIKLSPNFVAFVLQSVELNEKPEIGIRFFYWAGKQKKYVHKIECYVSLIELLTFSSDLVKIRLVFCELKDRGLLMTLSAANSLIKSFGNLGLVEELLWVWRRMKENGIEPSLYTYNFLVNGLVNSMFIESAERVFEAMDSGKIVPDTVTYNIMIKGYCKAGKMQKAMEKFRDMEMKNVKPDKITYTTLIQACYSEGDFDMCLSLYLEMEEREWTFLLILIV